MRLPRTAGFLDASGDAQVGYMADACQSFAAEAVGTDGGQIFEGLQLRGCEALAENGQIIALSGQSGSQRVSGTKAHLNSMAVIGDLEKLEPTILDEYLQCGGAGIDGILDEFFQRMDGSDDYFSGCDFVDDVLR